MLVVLPCSMTAILQLCQLLTLSNQGACPMGGQSTTTQTQQSQTATWQVAPPLLQGILSQAGGALSNTALTGAETGALDTLKQNAAQGNPYAGGIGSYAQSLLNGGNALAQSPAVQSNLQTLQSRLTPYANGSMV